MKLKLLLISLSLTGMLLMTAFVPSQALVQAQGSKVFTAEELAQYDGQDGRKAYYAYEGKVYDVTGSPLWKAGQHYGLQAGQDLTGKMMDAPHGTEVFSGFEVLGTYGAPAATATAVQVSPVPAPVETAQTVESSNTAVSTDSTILPRRWYEGRIRIAGLSILGWTGILLGITFVGNFATCFALPWTKLPLPWRGSRPGPDALDSAQTHMRWGNVHKYFAWGTVVIGILHGILGYMQLLGYYL